MQTKNNVSQFQGGEYSAHATGHLQTQSSIVSQFRCGEYSALATGHLQTITNSMLKTFATVMDKFTHFVSASAQGDDDDDDSFRSVYVHEATGVD